MAALALGDFTMGRMAECAGLLGVSGLALHQSVVGLGVATATNGFRLFLAEGYIHWIVRVCMTAQTGWGLQVCPVAFVVVALGTGRNFTVRVMAAGAGYLGVVLGVCLSNGGQHPGMARIFVAGTALFLRGVFAVGYFHGLMGAGMAGEAGLVNLGARHMEDLAATLTVALGAVRNEAMRGVAVGAEQLGVFARKGF